MSPLWTVSTVLQWVAIAGLALVVLGLLRRVEDLRGALDRVDPREPDGPGLGLEVAPQRLVAMDGTPVRLGGEREDPLLVMFVQPDCGTCTAMADQLPALGGADAMVVMRGDRAAAQRELGALAGRIPVVLEDAFPAGYRPSDWTPSVMALSPDGHVAATGHPTRREHLDEMVAAARDAEWSTPDAIREHAWGVSAPYWELGAEAQGPG